MDYSGDYKKRPLRFWLLIYLVIGGLVYLLYYLLLAKPGTYISPSPTPSPTQTATAAPTASPTTSPTATPTTTPDLEVTIQVR